MNSNQESVERVIGLDAHPDSFTAAILQGPTPAAAITQKTFNQLPISQLKSWAKKQTTPQDLIVLEASGNSFEIVRRLAAIDRRALVLESCHLGKLKEAHANNDKISAVRIAKAYLAGTAKTVWVPDEHTQERRDWFHAHRKAVKRTAQLQARLRSYLSDHGIRLGRAEFQDHVCAKASISHAREWSPRQWQVIDGLLMEWRHAEEQRHYWEDIIAREVLEDPQLRSLVRLCGVRHITAFALGAIIGDIHRFETPAKLVNYFGLNPSFNDSGQGEWRGGIGGRGRGDVRSLLIESAHSIYNSHHPLAIWGRRLMARKGVKNVAVGAIARRLVVAIWYLMMGRWSDLKEPEPRLLVKINKILSRLNDDNSKQARKALRQEIVQALCEGLVIKLKKPPQPTPT